MTFSLQIVTPDGLQFDGEAERLLVPTTEGMVCILARHMNYVAILGSGPAKVVSEAGEQHAACAGGFLVVNDGRVRVLANAFRWCEPGAS